MADEEWVGTDRFAHQIGATLPVVPAEIAAPFDPDEAKPAGPKGMHKNFADGQARRAKILELVTTGKLIKDCVSEAGVSLRT